MRVPWKRRVAAGLDGFLKSLPVEWQKHDCCSFMCSKNTEELPYTEIGYKRIEKKISDFFAFAYLDQSFPVCLNK